MSLFAFSASFIDTQSNNRQQDQHDGNLWEWLITDSMKVFQTDRRNLLTLYCGVPLGHWLAVFSFGNPLLHMYLLWKGFVSVVCFCLFSSLTHQQCINSKGISSRGYYKAFSISTVLPCFTDTDKSFSMDQRGEQAINRDAKTTGGIKAFSVTKESVLKCCLNRSDETNIRKIFEKCVDLLAFLAYPNHHTRHNFQSLNILFKMSCTFW
jgi:hypothetical protein